MLLYKKQLFDASLAVFEQLNINDSIKCRLNIKVLACFSANLESDLFTDEHSDNEKMPIDISSIDFALQRINAYKAVCEKLKLNDKRQKDILGEFGIILQRNLFYGKELKYERNNSDTST